MNYRKALSTLSLSAICALGAGHATAITNGDLDGDAHPHVGLMVAKDATGTPRWRCSGTLISPTLFLTAGHCTYGAARVEIWFDPDMQTDAGAKGYPYTGEVWGTPHAHPSYNPNAFFLYDLGVVVLNAPVTMNTYGSLPMLNQLDALKTRRGLQDTTFTAVGYGLQQSFPDAAAWKENNVRIRMVSTPRLVAINVPGYTGDFSILLSNNANTGGTCFGDSGGPNFVGSSNVIAGVTSYGNTTCTGRGGVYRIDRADDLSWLATFFP